MGHEGRGRLRHPLVRVGLRATRSPADDAAAMFI